MSTNPIEEIREENKRLAQAVQEWKPLAEADPSFGVLLLELEVLVDNVHERAMHGERLQEEVERLKREGAPESKVDRAVGEWEAGVDQTRGALDEAKTKRRAIEDAAKSVSLMPVVPTSAPLTPPPPAPVVGAGTAALTGTGGTGAGAPKGKGGAKAGKAAAVAAPVAAASPPMWPPGTPGGVGGPPRPPG